MSVTAATHIRQLGYVTAMVLLAVLLVAVRCDVVLADVDMTAPNPPNEIFVDQGTAWMANNHFDVWWHIPPGQQSPIAAAHYQLCPVVPLGPCTDHRFAGTSISQMDLTLPHAGWFWLRVWLEDAAGNVNPDAKSSEAMVRFDDGKPPEAFLRHDDIWLNNGTPADPNFVV